MVVLPRSGLQNNSAPAYLVSMQVTLCPAVWSLPYCSSVPQDSHCSTTPNSDFFVEENCPSSDGSRELCYSGWSSCCLSLTSLHLSCCSSQCHSSGSLCCWSRLQSQALHGGGQSKSTRTFLLVLLGRWWLLAESWNGKVRTDVAVHYSLSMKTLKTHLYLS